MPVIFRLLVAAAALRNFRNYNISQRVFRRRFFDARCLSNPKKSPVPPFNSVSLCAAPLGWAPRQSVAAHTIFIRVLRCGLG